MQGKNLQIHSILTHPPLFRNYVTFDIIRRILSDYFGYEVFSVMNITDVDDKIILKARRTYLFDKYEKEHPVLTKVGVHFTLATKVHLGSD
jgi:cysteinyl-tRNA synthetase